jgi:uncharacterized protein YidB (DUF937 family)
MGLMDVLNGMQNGPRGQREPSAPGAGGGMSPITMALLGLLAYKALKHFTGGQQPGASPAGAPGRTSPSPMPLPDSGTTAGAPGGAGNLGDVLKGGLGGLLAGGAAGSILSGGLNDLLKQFQQSGQGEVADSWIGKGPNKEISPGDLGKALGEDQINTLAAHAGLSRDDLLEGLSQYLPRVVDQLTPEGRLPTEHEAGRMV